MTKHDPVSPSMDLKITQRGFDLINFKDTQGADCSLQKSSSAEESKIWLGTDDADPRVLVKYEGWQPVSMPDGVIYNTRMHLNREQVAALLPYLVNFVETGDLSKDESICGLSEKIVDDINAGRYEKLRDCSASLGNANAIMVSRSIGGVFISVTPRYVATHSVDDIVNRVYALIVAWDRFNPKAIALGAKLPLSVLD